MSDWTHLDETGDARMVDVGDKDVTDRRAIARGFVYMEEETLKAIERTELEKGEVSQVSRIAGIMGAKSTPDLIPLCHRIPLDSVSVRFEPMLEEGALAIEASAQTSAKTGVEMEALTAVSTAALTVYDMCKGRDQRLSIGDIHLVDKRGGTSGGSGHPSPPGPAVESSDDAVDGASPHDGDGGDP